MVNRTPPQAETDGDVVTSFGASDLIIVHPNGVARGKVITTTNFQNSLRAASSIAAGSMSTADFDKLDNIQAAADVTDATNVNDAGAVMETDFNANTILAANADNTPLPLPIAEQEMFGRITAGNMKGLSPTEGRTLLNVADGADVSSGLFDIWIPAGAMEPTVTSGCGTFTTAEISSTRPNLHHLPFDQTAEEFADFSWRMPKRWDEGTITFSVRWSHATGGTAFGVAWKLQALSVSNDDSINQVFGTAITVTDTGGTTDDSYETSASAAVTPGGTAAESDQVFLRISRDPANGADTLDLDARLHGIILHITTNAGTDD